MSLESTDRRLRFIRCGSEEEEHQIVAALDDPTIRILLPDAPAFSQQLLAITLVDLLGRVFPRIEVVCKASVSSDPALPPGAEMLIERLVEARQHGFKQLPIGPPVFTVAIGQGVGEADLCADGHGWQSYLGTERSRLSQEPASRVPVGALVAACRVAAHTFAQLLDGFRPARELPVSVYASALTYSCSIDPLEERSFQIHGQLEAVLVGAGSIGGAAVYLLARIPDLAGSLSIIDPQSLESRNLDRAILAPAADADAERVKVEVASGALMHLSDLMVDPRQETSADYVASRAREDVLPLVLCAVDSPASRREIQDCIPLELINAACSQSEVMISGHRTDDGPCVCCLHMPDVMDAKKIRARLISEATGLVFRQVVVWINQRTPLPAQAIGGIESNTQRPKGSLSGYVGRTIDELWSEQFMYGAAAVGKDNGAAAQVAAPWVTALGGFLLATEALKTVVPDLEGYRLGPSGKGFGTRYAEAVYATPMFAQLTFPPRWSGSECLCRSPRRLRLLRARYGLSVR
jgi:hypothetical protein